MNMSWGHKQLSEQEKAEIILKTLDKYIAVDWNFKNIYIKAIKEGLNEIKTKEV